MKKSNLIIIICIIVLIICIASIVIVKISNNNDNSKEDKTQLSQYYDAESLGKLKGTEVIGHVVSNYKSGNDENIEWKILYAGNIEDNSNELIEPRIYLVASDYVPAKDIPKEIFNVSSGDDYKFYFNDDNKQYADDLESVKEETLRNLLKAFYDKVKSAPRKSSSNFSNTAAMLDQSKWNGFKDTNGYAEFIIGGPTLELYYQAYNKMYYTNKHANASSTNGYFVKSAYSSSSVTTVDEDDKLEQDNFFVIKNTDKAKGWWLASPADSVDDKKGTLGVSYSGTIINGEKNMILGVRPVAILDKNVKMQKQDDGTFKIIDNEQN